MRWILGILILVGSSVNLYSDENFELNLESILESVSYESSFSVDIDNIEYLHDNPIYLKNASFSDLMKIPGFSSSVIASILKIASQDSVNNFEQLLAILHLSNEQIFLLKYCTTFKKYRKKDLRYLKFRTRNKSYLINPESYNTGKVLGDKLDLYNRLSANFDGYQMNLTIDKDFGERNLTDFISGNISYNSRYFTLILGDYVVKSAMGNVLWKPFSARKGASVISPAIQFDNDISPYKSSLDYYFHRGIAFKYSYEINPDESWNIISWFSCKNMSANIDTGLIYGDDYVLEYASSIYKAGYFRTQNDIDKLNKLKEKNFGTSLFYEGSNLNFGALYNAFLYDKFIYTQSSIDILGKNAQFFSLFGKYEFGKMVLAGEYTFDDRRNIGLKIALNKLEENIEYVVHIRAFQSDFKSPYGMIFGERSYPNNELGLYIGLKYYLNDKISISNYLDIYNSLTTVDDKRFYGSDFFTQLDCKLDNRILLITRFVYENKYTSSIGTIGKYRLRLNLDKKINKDLTTRIRLEFVALDGNKHEIGNILRFDLKYNLFDNVYSGISYTLFNTDSYYSAIWQYEMPVNGYMTTIPLYGQGYRTLGYINAEIFDNVKFKIVGIFYMKNNVDKMGSGILEINGNKDIRILAQLEFKF